MSNPPAGWYPDPTGQPNIIRFWNGEKWTNQTEHEDAEPAPEESHASTTPRPAEPMQQASFAEPSGSGLRSVQESQNEPAESGGWWQPSPTPQLWDLDPTGDGAQDAPRLRAVSPEEESAEEAGPSAAERAQATWGAPEIAPAPPEHWTQREVTEDELEAERGTTAADVPNAQAEEQSGGWTLKLAPEPTPNDPPATTEADEGADSAEASSDVSWSEQPRFAPTPKEDAHHAQPTETQAAEVQAADAEVQAADAAEVAAQLQPDWGSQSGDQQEEQTSDQPAWGVETGDQEDLQTPDHPAAPLWTMPDADDATQEQSGWNAQSTPDVQEPSQVQPWGDQPQQQNWDAQQATAETQNGQQAGEQAWGGQSWPAQQTGGGSWAGDQQGAGQSWGAGQQSDQQQWGVQQNGGQQGLGVQQGVGQQGVGQQGVGQQDFQQGGGQQAWGDQQAPRAWGEDESEAWGGQTDLSSGVGKRDQGKGKKSKSSGGGGVPSGAKLPLIIGGGVALVMLIVAAVFLITSSGDDKKADPGPTTSATQPTGSPTSQSSTKPGQSKNPKLHEGIGRISSDAISFPRRNPPWSDRKRLVQQLLNSSGQHIVLQENANGSDDWTADIFVGGLGTGSGFNGDPKATAAALSVQLRTSMYGSIPATYRTVANGAVKRTDKSGWFFQQTVTAKSAAVTDRVLTLTVAVFDLGDGTAVAYISGIPNNRPDLKAAESQAYKGINVG